MLTLGAEPEGKVAVKLSIGEPPSSNYLQPELIKDLVQSLDGTVVECNTAYGGRRDNTEYHLQVAKDHRFTDIADFTGNPAQETYIRSNTASKQKSRKSIRVFYLKTV